MLGIFIISTILCSLGVSSYNPHDANFDEFVMAQQWPESVCVIGNLTHQYECYINQNISTWSMHGLWPTLNGTFGPNYCNDSAKFDPVAIQPLLPQLTQNWPNLHTNEGFYSFWTHEWEKHGTCAADMEVLRGEYNYFATSLKLHERFNLVSLLSKAGFPPSTTGYNYTDLLAATKKVIGAEVVLGCFYQKKYHVQYLEQIELCLDRNFKVVNCKHSSGGCSTAHPVMYLPIKHPF